MTRILLLAVFSIPLHAAAAVSVCELLANPAAYDRQVIDVTAFVSHGFEDFTLFDPRCENSVWTEYGGTFASGTIYCCGPDASRSRKAPLEVEGVATTIVRDRKLKHFDRLVQREPDSIVHATLRGRFFADEEGRGYGHFGLFPLLVIEQVLAVDPHDRRDVDYRAGTDAPDADCVSSEFASHEEILEQQRSAENERSWAFTDPARVAAERRPGVSLRAVSRQGGRITYEGDAVTVVVSRPYWLTFFAANRARVAWVAVAVYETGC